MNHCNHMISENKCVLGEQVQLTAVKEWAEMTDEVRITNLDKPLFAFYPYSAFYVPREVPNLSASLQEVISGRTLKVRSNLQVYPQEAGSRC